MEKTKIKRKRDNVFRIIVKYVIIISLCLLILLPSIADVLFSFMTKGDLCDPSVIFIPRNVTFDNYRTMADVLYFNDTLKESLVLSLIVAIIQVVMCSFTAYGFARFKFPLKKLWMGALFIVITFIPVITAYSLNLNFKFFDFFGIISAIKGEPIRLVGKTQAQILMCVFCMGIRSGMIIYFFYSFFRGIPDDIEEASYIDGSGCFRTYFKIMLPQAKSILGTGFLMTFIWQYMDGFYAKCFMSDELLLGPRFARILDLSSLYRVIYRGEYYGQDPLEYSICLIKTGMIMIVLPMVILYVFTQLFIFRGIDDFTSGVCKRKIKD